jgi:phosphate uptake regulator
MNRFLEDVRLLRQRVLRMGQLAEGMVAFSISALTMRDPALHHQVRSREPILARLQVEIDREASGS